ncbi:outer membrane beta-barrel protein [Sphingobacterium oryzagri]|uniref:Outer membrane beta-barrel protein n=1 Tax=Sphingobacterium oryzagri TaxID=3025669 RepID=A0ABY7WGX7_9SPHI|nr:outer membrane beta-barrel protein [Sphingobacterium sp. KACC 22765]WDF68884.1 outer membrane beta-barrel protein [Sphingobacterium sp. KACC 22765]
MKQFLLLMTLLSFLLPGKALYAQSGKTVQGMLRDKESRVVAGASVQLIAGTDTAGTSSTQAGIFTFENVNAQAFKIKVTSLGFEPFEKEFSFSTGQDKLIIPSFELQGIENMLEEVVINGVVTVQVKGDTVEYATKNLKLREGSVAEDALKKLQGVEVDKDGNVTAQGESVTRVRINGKDFFGGDVKTATQNLPANIIEKMQIVDDYGDMANLTGNKNGESTKVLNIQIDPQYNKGYMTTLRVGAGTEERYQATGMLMALNNKTQVSVLGNLNNMNANLFDFSAMGGGARNRQGGGGGRGGNPWSGTSGLTNTGSLGLNIRHDFSEKLKVYGSYSFGRDDNHVLGQSIRTTTLEGDLTQVDNSQDTSNTINTNHRFEANVEWNITDKDYIKITPQFGFGGNDQNALTYSSSLLGGVLNNTQTQNALSTSTTPRYGVSGLYNRKLNDKGRNFFLNFNYDNAIAESDYNTTLDRLIADPNNADQTMQSIYEQTIREVQNKSWNAGGTLSYTEPIGEKGRVELTYDLNTNDYDNHDAQQAFDGRGTILNDQKLNYSYDYDYSFTTHRAGASYSHRGDKLIYSLGAAVQPSVLSGNAYSGNMSEIIDRKNFNIIPIARFEYKFSSQKNISINYSGSATEPSVTQILPFDVSTIRTITTIGNPDLDPEFNHRVQARFRSGNFQKGNTFFAMVNANLTNDKIVSFNKTYNDQSEQNLGLLNEIRYLNETAEPVYGVNSFYHFGKSIKDKTYNISLMGGISYNKNISYVSTDPDAVTGEKNIANNLVFNQGLMFRYNPSENLEINPGIRYVYNYTNNSTREQANNVQSWTPNLIGSVNISATTIFGVDVSKTFNNGYGAGIDANPFIINTYLEQRFLKGQRGTLRLQAFDLLNEQTNISRTVEQNFILDSQTNRLGRYFMLTFTFKLQKFSGVNPFQEDRGPGGMRRPRM